MTRHRLAENTTPADMSTVDIRDLVLFFNTLVLQKNKLGTQIQKELTRDGNNFLTRRQQQQWHEIAEHYAAAALSYAEMDPGGRDHDRASAPLLLIHNAQRVAQQLRADLGLPDHVESHDVYAITCAVLPAFVWIKIRYGHIEAERRYHRAIRVLRSAGKFRTQADRPAENTFTNW